RQHLALGTAARRQYSRAVRQRQEDRDRQGVSARPRLADLVGRAARQRPARAERGAPAARRRGTEALMRHATAVLATMLLTVAASPSPAIASPSRNAKQSLDQGRNAYDRGDYGRAITTIHPLLYPSIELSTEEEVVMAHRLLALSYFFVNKQ